MKAKAMRSFAVGGLLTVSTAFAALPPIGAAPKGDAVAVASRIIKDNWPNCKRVSRAKRTPDAAIRATCDGIDYLVFTMFNAKEGKTLELALNCAAAKKMNIAC